MKQKDKDEYDEFSPFEQEGDENSGNNNQVQSYDDIEDEDKHSNKMYYSVERDYEKSKLSDIYDPETSYEKKSMMNDLSIAFDKVLITHPSFGNLRSIDINKALPGDEIYYVEKPFLKGQTKVYMEIKQLCRIISVEDDKYKLLNDKGEEIETTIADIKPVDEIINKLKSDEMRNLYVIVRKNMPKIGSEMEYFDIFSSYFRIHEKVLYDSLPESIHNKLLTELNAKTNVFSKKNIIPMW